MKPSIWGLVLLGLGACAERGDPAPAAGHAEAPLGTTPAANTAAAKTPGTPAGSASENATAGQNALVVVQDRNQVCMVNDQYMGREQIPVVIGEKTYYGCCPMCKGRLEQDPGARTAKDPVTGSAVDKATAVVGRAPTGQVFYFESEETLRQYKL